MAPLRLLFGLALCGNSLNPVTLLSHQQKTTRKPVVWLHVHKSAGSTICETARQNGENTALGDIGNCNLLSDDVMNLHRDDAALKPLTCAERRQQARAGSVTWMQIEREFNEGDLCDGFLYGTSLRDPAMLAQSLVNYYGVGAGYKKCLEKPAEHCAEKTVGHAPEGLPFLDSSEPVWLYFDNFLVRVLGGHDVMMLPPGAINASHQQMALDVLAKFDLAIRVEDLATNASVERFRDTFGWSQPELLMERENAQGHSVRFSAEELERYKDLNQHDFAVYSSVGVL